MHDFPVHIGSGQILLSERQCFEEDLCVLEPEPAAEFEPDAAAEEFSSVGYEPEDSLAAVAENEQVGSSAEAVVSEREGSNVVAVVPELAAEFAPDVRCVEVVSAVADWYSSVEAFGAVSANAYPATLCRSYPLGRRNPCSVALQQ